MLFICFCYISFKLSAKRTKLLRICLANPNMASLSTALLEVFSFLLSFKGSFPSLVKYPLFDVFDFLTRHAHHAHCRAVFLWVSVVLEYLAQAIEGLTSHLHMAWGLGYALVYSAILGSQPHLCTLLTARLVHRPTKALKYYEIAKCWQYLQSHRQHSKMSTYRGGPRGAGLHRTFNVTCFSLNYAKFKSHIKW